MKHAINCIKEVAQRTSRVILFHSGNGKDSIALLDLMYPHFEEIILVYMYSVKNLEHIDKYFVWAKQTYPKIKIDQVPHYTLSQYYKHGLFGCKKIPNQRIYNLNNITEMSKVKHNIEWAVFGFKQSDSMNRRLMLKTYKDECIYENTKNAYPFSKYTNKDVLAYIKKKKLIPPTVYGKGRSQGVDISSLAFLLYCKAYYPNDYQKVIQAFPETERLVFEYENYNEKYDNE